MKATLYYDEYDELLGRALTKDEYENLTLADLQDAIVHSLWRFEEVDCKDDAEFYALSVDELTKRLNSNGLMVLRSDSPLFRDEFPPITRGPRKGLPNRKKEPQFYEDRLYCVEYTSDDLVVVRDAEIEEDEDGNFVVLGKEAA